MDALTAFVASAHLQLRLELIRRRPALVKETTMTPNFKGLGAALAKMKHDLEIQSGPLMADLESLSQEAPDLLKQAAAEVAKTKQAVADIKDFVKGLTGNGGPPSPGSSASSDKSGAAEPPVTSGSSVVGQDTSALTTAAPEKLTVNGAVVADGTVTGA